MLDKETDSLWSHVTGEALEGAMKGKQLENLPVVQTTWSDWVRQHPDTRLLRKEREIRSSRYEKYFKDPERTGMFRARWLRDRLPAKDMVHGITSGPHALAVSDRKLESARVLNVKMKADEDPVVMARTADGGVRAYIAKAGGKTLRFHRAGNPPAVLDRETRSVWDMEKGVCVSGALKGSALKEVVVRTAFWFAWSSFYPNTEVID